MERIDAAAEEGVAESFLSAIRPPRLEDAGLESCALPLDSIIEAFSRAAASFKSRVSTSFSGSGENGECVQDPGPSNGEIPDKLLDLGEILPPERPFCGIGTKETEFDGAKDEVVVVGHGDLETDRVLVIGDKGDDGERKRGCTVDGELLPGVKDDHACDGDLEEDDERKDGPILVEGLI